MEIRISRSNKRCCASDQDFVHNDEIVSLVRYSEGNLVREDYAREHWSEDLGDGAYSVWTTHYYDPQAADQEPEEKYSPLRQLFYGSQGAENRAAQAVAFLAAQLLRRQKVFRQVRESEETEEGGKLILYVDRIGNRLIEVRDPNFTYNELESARLRLMDELRTLEAGPASEADPETEATSEPEEAERMDDGVEAEPGQEESAEPDAELAAVATADDDKAMVEVNE